MRPPFTIAVTLLLILLALSNLPTATHALAHGALLAAVPPGCAKLTCASGCELINSTAVCTCPPGNRVDSQGRCFSLEDDKKEALAEDRELAIDRRHDAEDRVYHRSQLAAELKEFAALEANDDRDVEVDDVAILKGVRDRAERR